MNARESDSCRDRMHAARGVAACVFAVGLLLSAPVFAAPPQSVRLDLTLRETVHATPEESAIVDSVSVVANFYQETTIRVGNIVAYVDLTPSGDDNVGIEYALFATGPISEQRSDQLVIEYGTPIIFDDIKGKGKSTYRVLITPHRSDSVLAGTVLPTEAGQWMVVPSAFFMFHVPQNSLAMFHFTELRNAVQYEFEGVMDSLDLSAPGKVDYYFIEGNSVDVPLDPRLDFSIDPSRNRIVARHDRYYTGVDAAAALYLKCYRWWGYAPEFLTLGTAGYITFPDYDVIQDRANGQSIPLASLARSIDFKRQPFPAAWHHAASFVRWLIHKYGMPAFRDLYGKATDLSFERAVWSAYGLTLDELEAAWLAYLKQRQFTSEEYYTFARRAAAYHNYSRHLELLKRAAESDGPKPAMLNRELTLAASQVGHWQEALDYAYQNAEAAPSDPARLSLLAEVQWAVGDIDGCRFHLLQLTRLDSADARPYILLGDLQDEERRPEEAARLWYEGLRRTDNVDPARLELLLRLGQAERDRRNRDSARVLFSQALAQAKALISKKPDNARPFTRLGEALMELDSAEVALPYFEIAAYVADAPQELGRVYLGIGHCHDLAGRRQTAVQAYESVFAIPATYYHEKAARYYVNHIYKH